MRPNKLKYYSSHMIHVELYSAHGSVNSLSYGIKSLYVNYDMYVCKYGVNTIFTVQWPGVIEEITSHSITSSMQYCTLTNLHSICYRYMLYYMLYTTHPAIVYMHTCCYMYMLHNTSCYCIFLYMLYKTSMHTCCYMYMLLHVHVAQYILLLYIHIHVVQDIYAYMLLHVLHVVTCTTCSTRHMFPAWLPDNCMKDQGRLSGHFIYYILKYNPSIVVTNSWLE